MPAASVAVGSEGVMSWEAQDACRGSRLLKRLHAWAMIANAVFSSISPCPPRPIVRSTRTTRPRRSAADAAPSKTRRKKDMHALQDLGATLVGLEPSRLAALGLPERLADAIAQARSITKHEARRRQMQYVGR